VSHAGDAREDFMQVDFRTACLRVLDVLPVDYEDPHEDLRLQIVDWRLMVGDWVIDDWGLMIDDW
jgi:hypothetical protein